MNVAPSAADLALRPRAVAIGTFDGVHLGHRAVVGAAVAAGRGGDLCPTVVTFHPHPRTVLGKRVELLATLERRLELLEAAGVEDVLVVQFRPEIAALEPADFARQYLVGIGARVVVAGTGFHFGKARAGDLELLRSLGHRRARGATRRGRVVDEDPPARPRRRGRSCRPPARPPARGRRGGRRRRPARRDARVPDGEPRSRPGGARPRLRDLRRRRRAAGAPRSPSGSTRTTAARSAGSRRTCSTGRATSTATGSWSSSGSGCATSGRSAARRSSSSRSPATSSRRGRRSHPSTAAG